MNPGEQKINITLEGEKSFKLKVTTYNYENFFPLENVHIKVNPPNDDQVLEGLSDQNGSYIFETSRNHDYLTITAVKGGYLLGQRTFVKDLSGLVQNTDIGNTSKDVNEVQTEMVIIMVKESLILQEKAIVFISYSSCYGENFEPLFLYSDKVSDYIEIQCSDTQKDIGVLSTQFRISILT